MDQDKQRKGEKNTTFYSRSFTNKLWNKKDLVSMNSAYIKENEKYKL